MKKEELNKIKELLNDANCIVMATDIGSFVYGKQDDVMSTMGALIACMYHNKKTNKKLLKKVVYAAVADKEELLQMLQEEFDKFKEDIKAKEGKDE